MNYYRELAFALRVRGLSEDSIRSTLDDVRAHSAEAGEPPASQFGTPEEYAARFEAQKPRTAGRRFVTVMVVAAVVVVILLFVVAKVSGESLRLGGFSVPLLAGVLVAIVGFVGGFLLDRRLPEGFRLERSAR